jgi:hypothetical protein
MPNMAKPGAYAADDLGIERALGADSFPPAPLELVK